MKKPKPKFNSKQRAILQLLNKSRTGLTIYDISKQTGIAWVTVKKYLNELVKRGIVDKIE